MGKIYNAVLDNVDAGMKGYNRGLPMGLSKVTDVIYDVQRGRYDLVAGKTSSGKTAFVDQCYVIEPFLHVLRHPEIKLDILYYSLEISPEEKFAKIASRFLYEKYNVTVDSNKLLSRGNFMLSTDIRKKLEELKDVFNKLESMLHIYDAYTTRTSIMESVRSFLDIHGEYSEVDGRWIYTPNHPNHYVLVVIDNYNNLDTERGETKKQAIDGLSKALVRCRNMTGISPVCVQQFNADISDPRRIQQQRYEPITDDLEDSKMTSKDANTILALYDPLEYNITTHRDYDIARLNGRYRQLQVLKNRNGQRGDRVGLHLFGEVGIFSELPRAREMTHADYVKYG